MAIRFLDAPPVKQAPVKQAPVEPVKQALVKQARKPGSVRSSPEARRAYMRDYMRRRRSKAGLRDILEPGAGRKPEPTP